MTEPNFLSLANVIRIHQSCIDAYGGEPTVRDMGLLESAIGQPRASFAGQFLHEDLFAMAAAYLFHIVNNHPFVDGNKRTGALAAFTFLQMNDVDLKAPQAQFEQLTLSVARGGAGKNIVADFFRKFGHSLRS